MPLLYEVTISEYSWRGSFIIISGLPLQCFVTALIITKSEKYLLHDTKAEEEQPKTTDGSAKGTSGSAYISLLTDAVVVIALINCFQMALTGMYK